QRRVNDPRTRRIGAAGQFLDGADEIIAVARRRLDQLEQHQPQFASIKHAPAAHDALHRFVDDAVDRIAEIHVERIESAPTAPAPGAGPGLAPTAATVMMSMCHETILSSVSMALRYILDSLMTRAAHRMGCI